MRYSFLLLSLFCRLCYGQEADSLHLAYSAAQDDSLKARTCLRLGDYYENRRIDEALKWGDQAIIHARAFNDSRFIVKVLNYASTFYNRKGNFHHQVDLGLEAIAIAEKNDFFKEQGIIASNLGAAYIRLEDPEQAIYWLMRAINLKKKYSTEEKLIVTIGNLGTYYFELEDYAAATKQHEEALEIRRRLGVEENIAITLASLAGCYMMLEHYSEAEALFREAYMIRTEQDDQYGLNQIMLEFSWLYELKGDLNRSVKYADSAYNMALELKFDEMHHDAALQLGTVYEKIGKPKLGYRYLLEAYNLWQEMNLAQATENINELRAQYEIEKIEGENLLLIKDGEIKDLSLERNDASLTNQRLIIGSGTFLLVIAFVALFYLNRLNKEKRLRNDLLKEQKKLVETKSDEIQASIQYAKRIQAAILPQYKAVTDALNNVFVIFKPKDVVAGDFYWLEKRDSCILFAVADCTGHGVPGAMVSVVCNNGLNRSVREHGLTDPGKILDSTREIIVREFEKSEDDVKDGMDIALCCLEGNQLNYAGAHNPLWIIRKGELLHFKANKEPIGKFETPTPYTTHNIELEKGDTIYLFSDGLVDQFGGPQNKKYKSVNFKKLLLSIQEKSMGKQKELIQKAFYEWKGTEEQIDDVCVLGFRYE
ncbi:MAG: tetratricopeptide repeat protein [Crocinitomicaceae bacterium]|nr:tetratricopeptide repeat protein [Crocinitomicaceae bacterium]